MKKAFNSVIPAIVLLLSPALSYGEFSLPDYVYTIDDLDAAIGDADSYQQPINFVYSNEDNDCGLSSSASLDYVQRTGENNHCRLCFLEYREFELR